MRTYLCDDGNAEVEIEASSAEEAAKAYVEGGDWGEGDETFWVAVWVKEVPEDGSDEGCVERIKVPVHPEEPDCTDGNTHDWQSPHDIVGGIEENPGVWGHGGGVFFHEVCMNCGCARITDTWAQDPSDGEQGLTSVRYDGEQYADRVREIVVGRRGEELDQLLEDNGFSGETGTPGTILVKIEADEADAAEALFDKLGEILPDWAETCRLGEEEDADGARIKVEVAWSHL